MKRAWAYGTAIININTGKGYTIPEVKAMPRELLINLLATKTFWDDGERQEGGTSALAEIIGVNQMTIWNYVQCLYLEPETQAMIGSVIILVEYFCSEQTPSLLISGLGTDSVTKAF